MDFVKFLNRKEELKEHLKFIKRQSKFLFD